MKFIGIIPARYASSRFPGKPLAMLGDKTMIQRVYEATSKALETVYVATDDERIYNKVIEFGGKVVMTATTHQSGTDRIKEALDYITESFDVVVNIQGDEPFIQPHQIKTLCNCFNDPNTEIATLGVPFKTIEEIKNPNSPKIITNIQDYAIYFSRSIVPFIRGIEENEWIKHFPFIKHLGLYAYRSHILKEITSLPPSKLEQAESLEQLRWIENGYRIKVGITQTETIGIDTPEDLREAELFLTKLQSKTD